MNLKTRKLQIRLTEKELAYIKEHSVNYCSMSHYIRSEVKEYSDLSTVRMLQLIEALRHFYHVNSDAFSQVSANLNNAVNRANARPLQPHHPNLLLGISPSPNHQHPHLLRILLPATPSPDKTK